MTQTDAHSTAVCVIDCASREVTKNKPKLEYFTSTCQMSVRQSVTRPTQRSQYVVWAHEGSFMCDKPIFGQLQHNVMMYRVKQTVQSQKAEDHEKGVRNVNWQHSETVDSGCNVFILLIL